MNTKSPTFAPFANSTSSACIDELTLENGTDRIAVYGQISITRDRKGLAAARALKEHVDAIVTALEGEAGKLPNQLPAQPAAPTEKVDNPFTKG
jgi:hypothetical protein